MGNLLDVRKLLPQPRPQPLAQNGSSGIVYYDQFGRPVMMAMPPPAQPVRVQKIASSYGGGGGWGGRFNNNDDDDDSGGDLCLITPVPGTSKFVMSDATYPIMSGKIFEAFAVCTVSVTTKALWADANVNARGETTIVVAMREQLSNGQWGRTMLFDSNTARPAFAIWPPRPPQPPPVPGAPQHKLAPWTARVPVVAIEGLLGFGPFVEDESLLRSVPAPPVASYATYAAPQPQPQPQMVTYAAPPPQMVTYAPPQTVTYAQPQQLVPSYVQR